MNTQQEMNDKGALGTFLKEQAIAYEQNVLMSERTWIHRGGKTQYYVSPATEKELVVCVRYLYQQELPFKVIGHTSNLYFLNESEFFCIVSTKKIRDYQEKGDCFECSCGTPIAPLAKYAVENGIEGGYQGFVDLPGTVASAIVNNSSCYDCYVSDLLIDARVLMYNGEIRTVKYPDFEYSDRSSAFKQQKLRGVILSVRLKCQKSDNKGYIQSEAQKCSDIRKRYQEPPARNLGSIFPSYVTIAFYAHLPFIPKTLIRANRLLCRIVHCVPSQRVVKNILLGYYPEIRPIKQYISDKNVGCFVWRDANADEAFNVYRKWYCGIAGNNDTEIEVL